MQKLATGFQKSIVAGILVTVASLNVGAATVYEKDGTKVDFKGDLQIQLRQKVGVDQDLYMDYDDLSVSFGASHKNESGITAYGLLKMDWKGQASGDAKAAVDEGFIGLKYGPVAVEWGRLDWGSDKFETDQAIEIADGFVAHPTDKGVESIKAIIDLNLATLMLSTDLEVKDNSSAAEAYLVTNPKKLAGLALGVLYQTYQPATIPADDDEGTPAIKPDSIDTVGVRAVYSISNIKLGADYTTNDEIDVANVSVGVKIPNTATSVAAGMAMEMPDAGDDVNTWYANVKHSVHKNATVFAEIGGNDADDTDLGYLAGMKVTF